MYMYIPKEVQRSQRFEVQEIHTHAHTHTDRYVHISIEIIDSVVRLLTEQLSLEVGRFEVVLVISRLGWSYEQRETTIDGQSYGIHKGRKI